MKTIPIGKSNKDKRGNGRKRNKTCASAAGANVDAEEDRLTGNDGVGWRSHSEDGGRESSRKGLEAMLLTEQWSSLGPGISTGGHFSFARGCDVSIIWIFFVFIC